MEGKGYEPYESASHIGVKPYIIAFKLPRKKTKKMIIFKKNSKKFGDLTKMQYLCNRFVKEAIHGGYSSVG
ncbi:MAG: hypothetical protein K6A98_01440 [Prevotella sp.]|nr:hypothetical protein [Prevotella sp.]